MTRRSWIWELRRHLYRLIDKETPRACGGRKEIMLPEPTEKGRRLKALYDRTTPGELSARFYRAGHVGFVYWCDFLISAAARVSDDPARAGDFDRALEVMLGMEAGGEFDRAVADRVEAFLAAEPAS